MDYIPRLHPLVSVIEKKSVLLLGPRRTGKSAFLKHQVRADRRFDLLKADEFQTLSARPSFLRESLGESDRVVVIDEIQKLPGLLDEVHHLIENRGIRFVLTGSSARKLKRTPTSLMAGRARRLLFSPFSYREVKDRFDLSKCLERGMLPSIFLQTDGEEAWRDLKDYAGDYLREEILAEALVRKIEAFSRFLVTAASTNGELLNFEAIANDAQVPSRTVREYYAVLEDTLIGTALEPVRFRRGKSRKATATSKFFFFDTGVVNALVGRKSVGDDTPEAGNLLETFVAAELRKWMQQSEAASDAELRFWRSPQGEEVDFVLNGQIGIEVKATRHATERHASGLSTLGELMPLKRKIIVSRDTHPRKLGDVEVLPCERFLEQLWGDAFAS